MFVSTLRRRRRLLRWLTTLTHVTQIPQRLPKKESFYQEEAPYLSTFHFTKQRCNIVEYNANLNILGQYIMWVNGAPYVEQWSRRTAATLPGLAVRAFDRSHLSATRSFVSHVVSTTSMRHTYRQLTRYQSFDLLSSVKNKTIQPTTRWLSTFGKVFSLTTLKTQDLSPRIQSALTEHFFCTLLTAFLTRHGLESVAHQRQILVQRPLTFSLDAAKTSLDVKFPVPIPSEILINLPNPGASWRLIAATVLHVENPALTEEDVNAIVQRLASHFRLPMTVESVDTKERSLPKTTTTHSICPEKYDEVPLGTAGSLWLRKRDELQQYAGSMSPQLATSLSSSLLDVTTERSRWPHFPPNRSVLKVINFAVSFLLNYRFYLIYMARTLFQLARPLLAFCAFGEVMKIALAMLGSGPFVFGFSFVLAFEVLYFFLQCYISYVFLGMFFAAAF